jgi:hypothetical protein
MTDKVTVTGGAIKLTRLDADGHPVGETEILRARVTVETEGDGGYWERLRQDMHRCNCDPGPEGQHRVWCRAYHLEVTDEQPD